MNDHNSQLSATESIEERKIFILFFLEKKWKMMKLEGKRYRERGVVKFGGLRGVKTGRGQCQIPT